VPHRHRPGQQGLTLLVVVVQQEARLDQIPRHNNIWKTLV
jgi:hypothetical protein